MVRTVHIHGVDLGCSKDSFLDFNDFTVPLSHVSKKGRKKKEAEINLQQFKEEQKLIEKLPPASAEEIGEESEYTGEI